MLYSILSQINKGLRRIDILRKVEFSIAPQILEILASHNRLLYSNLLDPGRGKRIPSGDQPGAVPVADWLEGNRKFFYYSLYIDPSK